MAVPGRHHRSRSAGVPAFAVSGSGVLFPARVVACAVLAFVRLSVAVSSSSPLVAAHRLAVARSLRLVAPLGHRGPCRSASTKAPPWPAHHHAYPGAARKLAWPLLYGLVMRWPPLPISVWPLGEQAASSPRRQRSRPRDPRPFPQAGQAPQVPALLSLQTPSAKSGLRHRRTCGPCPPP